MEEKNVVLFNRALGKEIEKIRRMNFLTREDLSKKANISSKYIYEIECGDKSCSFFILYKIAKSLKVSIGELATSVENIKVL